MKHIAVVGTGTIGLMLGGFLTKGGYDVTIVSLFRPQVASLLRERGLTVTAGNEEWSVPVRAVFVGDIPAREMFDILFITGKSNDTVTALNKMLPHLAADGFVTSLQNGINEETIAARVGADRTIPCVCFAGGQSPEPNHVITHDGTFIVGELSGEATKRVRALADMLRCVKAVEITDSIMAARWRKLAEVSLTVPAACVSGYPLFAGFDDRRMQRLFGRLAVEVSAVETACGVRPEPIMGLTAEEWSLWGREENAALAEKFRRANDRPGPPPGTPLPRFVPEDAYTQDIRRGRPLEVWYTNGYITEKARQYGVPVPANDGLLSMIREIEGGKRTAAPDNLEELLGTLG